MKLIGVLGAGTMGCGIIQVLAQKGFEVVFIEREKTLIDKAASSIIKNL
ncbi:MAG: 3-hydroxyacyl-CoA dehydrogenase NAD-binding domain-containing protein, partial [Anaerovoracaceae bacterium]